MRGQESTDSSQAVNNTNGETSTVEKEISLALFLIFCFCWLAECDTHRAIFG